MKRWTSTVVSLTTLACTTMGIVALGQQPAFAIDPSPSYSTCSQQTVTVTLSDTDPTPYTIAGQLCLQSDALRGDSAVMLMISDFTYDRSYFNSPTQPSMYSWVYSATSRGYSTFNIDRLGVGQSSRPAADQLTVQTHAYAVAQIVQQLRAGLIGDHAFPTVIGVGQSLGAGILQYLAGTSTDETAIPDYLVLSSLLHEDNASATTLANSTHATSDDPVLSTENYPTGYVTTVPDTRSANFYYTNGANSAVIASDEAAKAAGSPQELVGLAAVTASSVSLNIAVPVALTVGQYDALLCDESAGLSCSSAAAITARESSHYGANACLTAFSVADTGHSIALHYKALDSFNAVHSWLDDNLINYASQKDANGCIPV